MQLYISEISCIANELLMVFRSEKKLSKEVYLNESIGADKEGNEISLIDVTAGEEEDMVDTIVQKDNLSRLGVFIDKVLTKREKKIIYMRYGIPDGEREYTQREIAELFGISRSYVSRIEKKALLKLKDAYEQQ
ncbi:MAG: sigma-70 family RNA polymerase sigma factor [Lachnospiraceae bacterium]|nr:sigma-70 family RNA polymerase sigma factor [Lachnospiraceae bacterium]